MRRLMQRYGNELFLLDATYKITRYALPLFFMVVKTNVDYQVVATFVIEGESTENIKFALNVIKEWNPSFDPKNAMVDCSKEEFNAIESLYPDCEVLICDFHREQAWERWFAAIKNGATAIKEEMLCRLRRISRARTEIEVDKALEDLRNCDEYKSESYVKMVNWLEKQWIPFTEKMVLVLP